MGSTSWRFLDRTAPSSVRRSGRLASAIRIPFPNENSRPFLKKEDLPQGSALGLFAVTADRSGDTAVYLVGGERLDRGFLQSLTVPSGTQVMLYRPAHSDLPAAGSCCGRRVCYIARGLSNPWFSSPCSDAVK